MKPKTIGTLLIAGLVVLSAMVVFATPALAEEEDPVLWVVPDNPTRWSGPSADELLNETVIEDVNMGSTFSGNVLVLNQESYGSPKADAIDVYLMFFVYDDSNIYNITIGTAKRINSTNPTIDPNPNSSSNAETLTFSQVAKYMAVPAGYAVNYSIGDIPFSGGSSKTGNPQEDLSTFNPDNADCYIEVPFTINFKTTPEVGFVLYAYADNFLDGQEWAHTAYSHDAGFYQIPEFTTIAIPVASILGLLFFFNHRKRRKAK